MILITLVSDLIRWCTSESGQRICRGFRLEIAKVLLEKRVFSRLGPLERSRSIRNHLQSTHNLSWTFQNNHQFVQLALVLEICWFSGLGRSWPPGYTGHPSHDSVHIGVAEASVGAPARDFSVDRWEGSRSRLQFIFSGIVEDVSTLCWPNMKVREQVSAPLRSKMCFLGFRLPSGQAFPKSLNVSRFLGDPPKFQIGQNVEAEKKLKKSSKLFFDWFFLNLIIFKSSVTHFQPHTTPAKLSFPFPVQMSR